MSPKILSKFLLGLSELLAKTAKDIADEDEPAAEIRGESAHCPVAADKDAVADLASVCAQIDKDASKPAKRKAAGNGYEAPCVINGTTAYFSFTHSDKARKKPFQWHSRIDSNITGNIGHPFDVTTKNDSNHCRTQAAKVFLAQTFGVRDPLIGKHDIHLIVCALGRAEKLNSAKYAFTHDSTKAKDAK